MNTFSKIMAIGALWTIPPTAWASTTNNISNNFTISKDSLSVHAKGAYLDVTEIISIDPHLDSNVQINIPLSSEIAIAGVAIDLGQGYRALGSTKADSTAPLTKSELPYYGILENTSISYWDYNTSKIALSNSLIFKGSLGHINGPFKLKFHWLQKTNNANGYLISSVMGVNQPFRLSLEVPDSIHWSLGTSKVMGSSSLLLDHADSLNSTDLNHVWWTELTGSLAGQYLSWRAQIPDSIQKKFYKRAELVVLWRWNSPTNFFDGQGNLSNWGQNALSQATWLNNFFVSQRKAGYQMGMVHSIFQEKPHAFPISRDTTSKEPAISWLKHWTSQELRSQFYRSQSSIANPNWKPVKVTTKSEELDSLYSHLKLTMAQFSDSSGVIREVIMISPDGQESYNPSLDLDSLKRLLKGASLVTTAGNWDGVKISDAQQTDSNLYYNLYEDIYIPKLDPNIFRVNVLGDIQHTLSKDSSFIARSTQWNQKMLVKAYYPNGHLADSLIWSPSWVKLDSDSNLVRIWATCGQQLGGKALDSVSQHLKIIPTNTPLALDTNLLGNNPLWLGADAPYKTGATSTIFERQGSSPLFQWQGNQLSLWLPIGTWDLTLVNAKGKIIWQQKVNGLQIINLPHQFDNQRLLLRIQAQDGQQWSLNLGAQS